MSTAKPIYGMGRKNGNGDGCYCIPETPPATTLTMLLSILTKLRSTIEKFYNPFQGVANVVGIMTMRAVVSTPVFMRLKWIEEHPGVKFDKTNPTHLDDIKFLYNITNQDWRKDPLFKAIGVVQGR